MVSLGLSRRSVRDISGNLVPLAILVFFALWFAIDRPWGWDLFALAVVYGLLVTLAALLFAVTYVTALAFQATDSDR
ncbi:DUF6684 family protein [Natronobiforma cellulositropha]|uniref:DUF6684 family protein n=1 Tax=Natronobiforma cellulositropha TaxID=1679076 RepID=UPI0021D5F2D1|nr:DUF6684 family protein [Natronobiforma cellulositropha]